MWRNLRHSPTVSKIASNQTLLFALVSFAGVSIAAALAIPTVYAAALLIAAAVLVTPVPIAIGGAFGVIIHDLFFGAVGYWTPVLSLWILVFAGGIALLSLDTIERSGGFGSLSAVDSVFAYVGTAIPAGIYATAAAAWLAVFLNGEPFYTAVTTLLLGIPITLAVGTAILITHGPSKRLNARVSTDSQIKNVSKPDGGIRHLIDQKAVTLAGHLALGTVWLLGTIGLDIAVRDLGLFATESQLVESLGFGGGGSLLSTAFMTVLIGIYRYGDVGILLSAPIAIVVIAAYTQYRTGSLIVKEASA